MMKAIFFNLILLLFISATFAQGIQIKAGDQFPDIPVRNLLNAPITAIQLAKPPAKKIYILNFWGTWCSPCIPEMDSLAKLQVRNAANIQVIGISNDSQPRLMKYLKTKPSEIWLSSDTSGLFYQLFSFSYVGQSAIINSKGKVVALVKTDAVNQQMINRLISGQGIKSSAEIKEKRVNTSDDIFAVDSSISESFTLRSYMTGQRSMSMRYGEKSVYSNRRITFINSTASSIYKEAYNLISPKQVAYEIPEKLVADFDNKQSLYCVDLLIKSGGKDSLNAALRRKLDQFMPIKARIELREMPVYVIVDKGFNQKKSDKTQLSYGFSGTGYNGTGATLTDFANDYLSNEFDLPVVDETGITEKYDINTNVELRTRDGIMKSINEIGLDLVKKTKRMEVLVFYK